MGHCPLKRVMDKGSFSKRGQEIMSQKEEERLSVEKRGLGEKMSIINFKDARLPPIASVLVHVPACWIHPGRLVHVTPLDY